METCTQVKYPEYWPIKRNPARPPELRVLNFNTLYDWNTLWYDAVQINPTTVLLIGPPLYDTKDWIQKHCHFQSLGEKLTHSFHELDRVCITVVSTKNNINRLDLITDLSRILSFNVNPTQQDF